MCENNCRTAQNPRVDSFARRTTMTDASVPDEEGGIAHERGTVRHIQKKE